MRFAAALTMIFVMGVLAQPKVEYPALNPANAKLARSIETVGSPATSMTFVEAKNLIVIGCEDRKLRLFPREEGKDLLVDAKMLTIDGHTSFITALASAGTQFVSASSDGKVLLWNAGTDKPIATLETKIAVRGIDLSADGKMLATVGDDKDVSLWELPSGKPIKKLPDSTDWLQTVRFTTDGKQLAAAGHDGKLRAWEVASGRKLFEVLGQATPAPKAVVETNVMTSLAWSPDGKTLAVGGQDAKIHLFQGNDGKYIRTLGGHTGTVTALNFHPNGQLMLSTSKDRTVRIWNPQAGAMVKALEGHTAWAEGVAFAERGTLAITTGADKSVRVWDLGAVPMPKPKK
jgi:WD40 repeat protein